MRAARTVHPTKSLSRHHLEINTLVTVFCVNQMREFHGIKLQGSISIDPICVTNKQSAFSGTTPLKSTKAVVILEKTHQY